MRTIVKIIPEYEKNVMLQWFYDVTEIAIDEMLCLHFKIPWNYKLKMRMQ